MLLQDLWRGASQVEAVPYSQFEQALAEGRIAEVTVRDHSITGRLKNPEGGKTLLVVWAPVRTCRVLAGFKMLMGLHPFCRDAGTDAAQACGLQISAWD